MRDTAVIAVSDSENKAERRINTNNITSSIFKTLKPVSYLIIWGMKIKQPTIIAQTVEKSTAPAATSFAIVAEALRVGVTRFTISSIEVFIISDMSTKHIARMSAISS